MVCIADGHCDVGKTSEDGDCCQPALELVLHQRQSGRASDDAVKKLAVQVAQQQSGISGHRGRRLCHSHSQRIVNAKLTCIRHQTTGPARDQN
ncbi:hypothetical protein PR003_g23032 [Phytophthora rubi]|nr:hypothetical protein PR002_g20629 [Phytophthora rubi]KAE9299322.1 hypothetical protein PR003_g23032 [Phytophthora rubi]